MSMNALYSWDQYFMTMAYLISMKSKDPSTRVGAVIVGKDHEIRSTGYNGLPRKVEDFSERYTEKDYKYYACNHAEENAILHCAKIGISTSGCILYTTWLPCSYCAKAIIQVGIEKVIYHKYFPGVLQKQNGDFRSERWGRSMQISQELLLEAGVELVGFSDKLVRINGLYNGNVFSIYDL